jgi:polysaccharide biosynthesis/export protein
LAAFVAFTTSGISAQLAAIEEEPPTSSALREMFILDILFFSGPTYEPITLGYFRMRPITIQRLIAKSIYYCVIIAVMSMTWSIENVSAQIVGPESLEALVDQLEELGGKAGKLNLGVSSAIDAARKNAAKGFAKSPLSRSEDSKYEELNTRFTLSEELLITRFCHGNATKSDHSILGVMREFSSIERDYCQRVSTKLLQIGYNVFDGFLNPELLVNGTIGDEYVLGIGDELVITLEGKENRDITTWIDREGRLNHNDLGRILASGLSFGEFRNNLQRLIEKTHFGTKVFVSLGSVRHIAVRVTGEVRKPGLHQLTGLSSIFDAISLAGGIKKTGSLRLVQVQRGNRIFWIDAYELIYPRFGGQDLVVRDGDHILVPPLGLTIGVAGEVKRPGIFELGEGQKTILPTKGLELAGGFIRSKGNALYKHSFDDQGRQTITELTKDSILLEDGDILFVQSRNNSAVGEVSIIGHVSNPGKKSISSTSSVRALLMSNNSLKVNPYLLFGVLETTDPSTRSRRFFPLNLQEIVEGKKDYGLRDKDRLIVFSQEQIRYLSSDEVLKTISNALVNTNKFETQNDTSKLEEKTQVITDQISKSLDTGNLSQAQLLLGNAKKESNKSTDKPQFVPYSCNGLRSLSTILQFTQSNRFASVVDALGGVDKSESVNTRNCPSIFHDNPDLLPFVLEHSVAVNGEVRVPGAYPVVANTPVSSLLAVAGGLSLDADISQIEISRFSVGVVNRDVFDFTKVGMHEVAVGPGDIAKFNPLFKNRDGGPVLLIGEFARPGLYDIRRGERLSEVIARAGGLTDQAYPYGAVFSRERVKRAQEVGFRRAARELKSAALFAAGKTKGSPDGIAALQKLTDEVVSTEALGRVVIEADPTVLGVRPELDSVLEPGDQIFMPKRPNSVLVIGDVLNPGALQFIAGTKADAYINQAGGLRQTADEDRMFLVYPNGVAQPVSVSVWNYNPVQVPPGSTLVVPMDPTPLDVFTFAKDMTTLISQMAITAASLAVIGNN